MKASAVRTTRLAAVSALSGLVLFALLISMGCDETQTPANTPTAGGEESHRGGDSSKPASNGAGERAGIEAGGTVAGPDTVGLTNGGAIASSDVGGRPSAGGSQSTAGQVAALAGEPIVGGGGEAVNGGGEPVMAGESHQQVAERCQRRVCKISPVGRCRP